MVQHHVQLEAASPAEAARMLADLARQLDAGVLDVAGTPIRVAAPVDVAVDADVYPDMARISLRLHCQRLEGVPRLLREELAHPGG